MESRGLWFWGTRWQRVVEDIQALWPPTEESRLNANLANLLGDGHEASDGSGR